MINIKKYALAQLSNYRKELVSMESIDFPYEYPRELLKWLITDVDNLKKEIERIHPAVEYKSARRLLAEVSALLNNNLPLLGYIKRSASHRNCFEMHGPLLRLSKQILGKIKLIISSEWDFSPFIIRPDGHLKKFVFVGFPATESFTPFLLPLSGHELGHAVWAKWDIGSRVNLFDQFVNCVKQERSTFEKLYPNLKVSELASLSKAQDTPLYVFCSRQIEEHFADVFGLRLFDQSYLYAFKYYLGPCQWMQQNLLHPSVNSRIVFLNRAAIKYNIDQLLFTNSLEEKDLKPETDSNKPKGNEARQFLSRLVESLRKSLEEEIFQIAETIIINAKIAKPNPAKVKDIMDTCFAEIVPAYGCNTLSEILNAGWLFYHLKTKWIGHEDLLENEFDVLSELLAKSIEIFEIEQIMKS